MAGKRHGRGMLCVNRPLKNLISGPLWVSYDSYNKHTLFSTQDWWLILLIERRHVLYEVGCDLLSKIYRWLNFRFRPLSNLQTHCSPLYYTSLWPFVYLLLPITQLMFPLTFSKNNRTVTFPGFPIESQQCYEAKKIYAMSTIPNPYRQALSNTFPNGTSYRLIDNVLSIYFTIQKNWPLEDAVMCVMIY